jgi:glycosyltransferase involved in cell wall biosynthesis
MPKVSIFIRTYKRDVAWLDFCLQSIHANLKGWHEIVVAVPEGQESHLRFLGSERAVATPRFAEDYVGQQVAKLQAHRHVTGDYVLFVDSDVIFLPGADVRDYLDGDRPRILTHAWPVSFQDPKADHRKDVSFLRKTFTENLLGSAMPHSFMSGHGVRLFRRSTLEAFDQRYPRMEAAARGLSRKVFSEYELLGFFTYLSERDAYGFVDAHPAASAHHTRQFWTIDGITPAALAELADLGFRPRWPSTLSWLDRAKAWLSQTTRAVKRRLKGPRP